MLVNAHSSNHEPNQEADRDPKQLSERNSLLCLITGPMSKMQPIQKKFINSPFLLTSGLDVDIDARRDAQTCRCFCAPGCAQLLHI